MTSTRRRAGLVATTLAALLGVGACSHGSESGGPVSSSGTGTAGGGYSSNDSVAGGAASRPAAGTAGGTTDSAAGSAVTTRGRATDTALLSSSSRIRTAALTVTVARSRDVAGRADRAGVIAEGAGGEIDSDTRSTGTDARADLVLRVPPDQLTPVLTALSGLGTEKSRRLATADVTERVADVTSRVASAQQAVARLRGLYARATRVADVISIEQELGTHEADLESLQAQQRALARQTSLATVTLSLSTSMAKAAPPARDGSGFLGGLHRGWHAFTSAASSVATAVGATLPFAVLVLIVGLLAGLAIRRLQRRPTGSAAPATGE